MRRWEVLGEVPDSEDEEFESLGSQGNNDGTREIHTPGAANLASLSQDKTQNLFFEQAAQNWAADVSNDVWDGPESSASEQPPSKRPVVVAAKPGLSRMSEGSDIHANSSPRGSLGGGQTSEKKLHSRSHQLPQDESAESSNRGDVLDIPSSPEQDLSEAPDVANTPQTLVPGPAVSPKPSPLTTSLLYSMGAQPGDFSLWEEDEISISRVELTAPPESDVVCTKQVSQISRPSHSPTRNRERPRLTAVRPERSFRPRKPIQQHPYLLENAFYSKAMKSHGIKPLRVALDPNASKGASKVDSLDRDFVVETESQETGSNPIEEPEIVIDGPSPTSGADTDDGNDDRDKLVSSPSLRTSPTILPNNSSQQIDGDHTDATSISSDEEFPSIDTLIRRSKTSRIKSTKRQTSTRTSSKVKRHNTLHLSSDAPLSPQLRRPPVSTSSLMGSPAQDNEPEGLGNTYVRMNPQRRDGDVPSSLHQAGVRDESNEDNVHVPLQSRASSVHKAPPPISPVKVFQAQAIEMISSEESENSDPGSLSSSSDSESQDLIRRNRRRIRGVLPASWLRLDQQKTKTAQRKSHRSREPSPERPVRRGIALPRRTSVGPSTAPPLRFDDSDMHDVDSSPPKPTERAAERRDIVNSPVASLYDFDDGVSVTEEDKIDRMVVGRKRSGPHTSEGRPNKKPKRAYTTFGRKKPRQPRITEALSRSKSTSSSADLRRPSGRPKRPRSPGTTKRVKRRAVTPPQLSILDVMEPKAPAFIRIAARAAKRRPDLGKTSPSKKMINLATRADNLDVLSTLQDWRSGRTSPRVTIPPRPQQAEPPARRPLREISVNVPARGLSSSLPSHRGPVKPRKLVRQNTLEGYVSTNNVEAGSTSRSTLALEKTSRRTPWRSTPQLHPAQLEESVEGEPSNQPGFSRRKRLLDALYRRDRQGVKESRIASLTQPGAGPSHNSSTHDTTDKVRLNPEPAVAHVARVGNRPRHRKRFVPRCIDLEAPQYVHANDPLPGEVLPMEDGEQEPDEPRHHDRLKGLGPYGTHYTQHFEIFPLDRGTFFHESTLIGRGVICKAMDRGSRENALHPRPIISFALGEQTLRWGTWAASTSSELGILVDWMAEKSFSETPSAENPAQASAVRAASFVMDYVLESINFESDQDVVAFVSRSVEVFRPFISRYDTQSGLRESMLSRKTQIEVMVCMCVATLATYRLARAFGIDFSQLYPVEELLKDTARSLVKALLLNGLEEVRTLYGELQHALTRERGIRPDAIAANGWVVVVRVLESASILKGSFWDVAGPVMMTPRLLSDHDAQTFERTWQNMFSVLPLCEFDNNGVLISGLRHRAPVEGWVIPQQLLKRVFSFYRNNARQSPGFNEYCRALVGRCHFLVQQWGWWRCNAIIGTIFDFFGSQNLSNLRNEEVYKSPRFLEELSGSPSLSVEPEDRCFHIFLKMLAVTIQKLKQIGRLNDIRNLVTRTLPNHNRQYRKEDAVTQQDLAALRNHHDLLCTLFWAAPAELRPPTSLIEKLILPGSSHREACLINMRAWRQLTQFIMSTGKADSALKPFLSWNNSVFQQVLDQYLSAKSDMEQQFRNLSKQVESVTPEMRDTMIEKNKASAMDTIHFCVKASLDTLNLADSLGTALHALNIFQLQKTFTSFDLSHPDFDWSIIHVALQTLDLFLDRVDKASEAQFSSDMSNATDPRELEEAVMVALDARLAREFFSLGRVAIRLPITAQTGNVGEKAMCVEKIVTVAGRIAARFKIDGVKQMAHYFSPGKYGLFSTHPRDLNLAERRYLSLFFDTLAKYLVFDLDDLKLSIFELWMLSVVKPARSLAYEHQLAETLQKKGFEFLHRADIPLHAKPHYNENLQYLSCGVLYMRQTLQKLSSTEGRIKRHEYGRILRQVMEQMKGDLRLLRSEAIEHRDYIDFVRQVISLIKSQGVGICQQIDPFFTQASSDYSPPIEDPELRVAGILAYGVRLSEKDVAAVPQLSNYLYTDFKLRLASDKLEDERAILEKVMENAEITSFILEFMMPAVVKATTKQNDAWPLLKVFLEAFQNSFCADGEEKVTTREIDPANMQHIVRLINLILECFLSLRGNGQNPLTTQQIYITNLLMALVNALQHSIRTYLFTNPVPKLPGLRHVIKSLTDFSGEVFDSFDDMTQSGNSQTRRASTEVDLGSILQRSLLRSMGRVSPTQAQLPRHVEDFVHYIVSDIAKTWIVTPEFITVQKGGRHDIGSSASTQSAWGTRNGPWEEAELLWNLHDQVGRWMANMAVGERRRRKRATFPLELFQDQAVGNLIF